MTTQLDLTSFVKYFFDNYFASITQQIFEIQNCVKKFNVDEVKWTSPFYFSSMFKVHITKNQNKVSTANGSKEQVITPFPQRLILHAIPI